MLCWFDSRVFETADSAICAHGALPATCTALERWQRQKVKSELSRLGGGRMNLNQDHPVYEFRHESTYLQ
jgi:hypothetical protein